MIITGSLLAPVITGACGVRTQDQASFVPDEEVPFGLRGTAPTSTSVSEGLSEPVCLVRDERLEIVDHPLSPPVTPWRLLEAAAEPTAGERQQGLATALTDAGLVDAATSGTGVTVALSQDFSRLPADVQLLAVAQVVCTLTEQPGTTEVRFTLDGPVVEVPRGDGSSTSDPVTRADYAGLITDARPS